MSNRVPPWRIIPYLGIWILLFKIVIQQGYAQNVTLLPWQEVQVTEQADTLAYGLTGGLNNPQIYEMDLTGNGSNELMVFDRDGGRILVFDWDGAWQWWPDAPVQWPEVENWVVPADYNCDQVPDLITGKANGLVQLYRGLRKNGKLQFHLVQDTMRYTDTKGVQDLYVGYIDIPGLADVNGDSDLDMLTFDPAGGFMLYLENQAMEQLGRCDTIILKLEDDCWGRFYETGINKTLLLDTCRPESISDTGKPDLRHAGSTVTPIDINRDGVMDAILGDLNFNNLNLLNNGGSMFAAEITSQDTAFPGYDIPTDLEVFPAVFKVDVDRDGVGDLAAAPNFANGSYNRDQVWYYRNTAPTGTSQYQRQQSDWLVGDMIDVGSNSAPVFMDVDADGLLDLIVGGGLIRETAGMQQGGLVLLKNTGTQSLPTFQIIEMDYGGVRSFNLDRIAPAVGDLDDDGDLDMLIGEINGKLHLLTNNGAPGGPAQFGAFSPLYMGIDVGSNSTPCIVDLDGDGLLDLIVGEKNGNLNYFHNTGTKQMPQFASTPDNALLGNVDVRMAGQLFGQSAPAAWRDSTGQLDLLVGNLSGQLHYYLNIEGITSGSFTMVSDHYQQIDVGGQSVPAPADLDGDKRMELGVGNSRGGVELYHWDQSIGINEPLPAFGLQVYPNPAKNVIYLFSKELAEIAIYNISGQKLLTTQVLPANTKKLYLTNWKPGLYLVEVKDGNRIALKKLLIIQ